MRQLFRGKQNCCGCTACESICAFDAISMQQDEEGFLYPIINESRCVGCEACSLVCPMQNDISISGQFEEPIVYAVKHKENEVRMNSASGGAYTAISNEIIDSSNGNFALYGVVFNKDDNFLVQHSRTLTKNGRDEFRGSKYVQSSIGNIFKLIHQDLTNGKFVLFSGTPCQNAGLNNYLKQVARGGEKEDLTNNLLLNDIICHGVSSPLLWKQYVEFIEKKYDSKIVEYTFRCKKIGWKGYNVEVTFKNGMKQVNTNSLMIYPNIFCSDLALRPSCYECKFCNFKRPSDITIGDYWGIEKTLPEMDDNKGVSLVLVNTSKGYRIFEQMKKDVDFCQSNITNCLQPNLQHSANRPKKRDWFWKKYYKNGFSFAVGFFNPNGYRYIIRKIKSLIIQS